MNFLEKTLAHVVDIEMGRAKLSNAALEYLLDERSACLQKMFRPATKKEYRIRPSGLGKPVCQQQHEYLGSPVDEDEPFQKSFRMFAGHDFEGLLIAYMLSAKVIKVGDVSVPVEVELNGIKYPGTADVIVEGKVYDVKTTRTLQGWENKGAAHVLETDKYGYATQLFLYSKALKIPAGGWIVYDKSTSHIALIEIDNLDKSMYNEYIKRAEDKVKQILSVKNIEDIEKEFELEEEKGAFGRLTGNKVVPQGCQYCPFKKACHGAEKVHNSWIVKE